MLSLGLSHRAVNWMTPREGQQALEGWRMQEHARWQRACHVANPWYDKALSADDFIPLDGTKRRTRSGLTVQEQQRRLDDLKSFFNHPEA